MWTFIKVRALGSILWGNVSPEICGATSKCLRASAYRFRPGLLWFKLRSRLRFLSNWFNFELNDNYKNSSLFDEFVCKLGPFRHAWAILKREWNERFKGPRVPKKAQLTNERVEYVFLFDEPRKGLKSLKTFKISLTFRFDKLWHLSKSVHIGENSQILTVFNKK
jgi:hypothetical protein